MEDKGKMDELIEQMKLMNERLGNVEKMLEESIYHQHRTDFTSEYVARQQGYTGFINEDIAVAPKPPSRLFGNHFIKITDTRLGEQYRKQSEGGMLPNNIVGKRYGVLDAGVDDIHDYRVKGNINRVGQIIEDEARKAHYLQSLTEDDTDKEDFVWLNGLRKYYHVVAKIEELSPYISGGTVVVLQKKTDAEIAQDISRMNKFQKSRKLHRGNKAYTDFF